MATIDLEMSNRLREEIYKLGDTFVEAAKKIGCTNKLVSNWVSNNTIPKAYYLQRLHYAGADVMYILVGERTIEPEVNTDYDRAGN